MIRMDIRMKCKMRKPYSIFLLSLLAVLMVGCERNVDINEDASVELDLPLPIEFAVPDTKVIINDREDMVGGIFGMFAIDKDPDVNIDEDDGLNMRNQLCRYDAETSSLKFGYANADKVIFYPMSDRCFSFYSYFTYTDELLESISSDVNEDDLVGEMTATDRRILVAINLARPYDVLYAMSEADGGFNSSYVRETADIPSFVFEHPAAGLGFRVQIDQSSSVPGDMDYLTFSGLKFLNVTTQAALCIVDKDNPENNGKFVKRISTAESKAWIKNNTGALSIYLSDKNVGDGVTGLTQGLISLGDEHFIMPQSGSLSMECKLNRVKMYYKDDGTLATSGNWTYTKSIELNPSLDGGGDGFQSGKMYRYKIIVKYDSTLKFPDDIKLTVVPDIVL